MVLLDPDPFLNKLTELFERTRNSGTVWVTMKRTNLKPKGRRKKDDATGPENVVAEPLEYRCLVRATDGKKKFSALLSAKDHQRFQMAYSTVLKAHMDALKKREKKDKKDKKAATKVPAS